MFEFLFGAAILFGGCWIWVGGYVADLVIWIVSRFVTESVDEKKVAIGIGVVFAVLGIFTAFAVESNTSSLAGGGIAGIGLYIAARVPEKVRERRLIEAIKRAEAETAMPGSSAVPDSAQDPL